MLKIYIYWHKCSQSQKVAAFQGLNDQCIYHYNLSKYLFQVLPVSIKLLRESLKLNFSKCNLINIKNGAIVVAWMFRNFHLMHLCRPLHISNSFSSFHKCDFIFLGGGGLYSKYQHDDCDFQQRLASSDRGGHHYKYIIQINIWSLINI